MELQRAVSKWVLYIGLIILAIGAFLFFKPKGHPIGLILMFVGFILSMFWTANRNDMMCPTDPNDNSPCVCVDCNK